MIATLGTQAAEVQSAPSSHGFAFDLSLTAFGELDDTSAIAHDVPALRRRMAEEGYLFFRRFLPGDDVLAARQELCRKLDAVGVLDHRYSILEAIASGAKAELGTQTVQAFDRDLRSGSALRQLCHGPVLQAFYREFLGGEPVPFRDIWVRTMRTGTASGVHFDWVYMGRGTRNLYTAWVPIGNIPLCDGPLAVLEGSQRIEELQQTYGRVDVDRDNLWEKPHHPYAGGLLTKDVRSLQARLGGRWLTADFEVGDLLVFSAFTLHCSLDNVSPCNRIRLSADTRYQLACEPGDRRWVSAMGVDRA